MNSCRSIVLLQRQVQLGTWVVRRSDQVGDGSRVGIFNSNIESKKILSSGANGAALHLPHLKNTGRGC